MKDKKPSSLTFPESCGWYSPGDRLAGILNTLLRKTMTASDLDSTEIIAFHQDRDHVLLRRLEDPSRVMVVHANPTRRKFDKLWPVVFEGTAIEFEMREGWRRMIEGQLTEKQTHHSGICPICSGPVVEELCGGVWSGSTSAKAHSGPLHAASCRRCHVSLIATPTKEEADAGSLVWEFYAWEDNQG